MVATEWYRIFSMTVPSTWIAFVLSAILTGVVLYIKFGKGASDPFFDLIFLFIVTWKLSIVMTNFSDIIKHPWMVLYFSGARAGVYIGVISTIFYLFYRQIIRKPLFSNQTFLFGYISFYSIFLFFLTLLNRSPFLDTMFMLIYIIFAGWITISNKESIYRVLFFWLLYVAFHLILEKNIISTSMITASIFAIIFLVQARFLKNIST